MKKLERRCYEENSIYCDYCNKYIGDAWSDYTPPYRFSWPECSGKYKVTSLNGIKSLDLCEVCLLAIDNEIEQHLLPYTKALESAQIDIYRRIYSRFDNKENDDVCDKNKL